MIKRHAIIVPDSVEQRLEYARSQLEIYGYLSGWKLKEVKLKSLDKLCAVGIYEVAE